jgi:hypothetical protein
MERSRVSDHDGSFPTTFCVAIAAAGGLLWIFRSPDITGQAAFVALATLLVSAVPSVLYLWRRNRNPMPFMPIVGIYYACFFAIPVFFFTNPPNPLREFGLHIERINFQSQLLVLAGVALMIAGYYVSARWFSRNVPYFRLPKQYPALRLRILLWLLVALNLLWYGISDLRSLPSIGQFIQPAGPLAVGMFVFLWTKKELPRFEVVVVFAGIIPFMVFRGIVSGLFTETVLLCAFLAVVLYYARLRMFWLWAVLPVLFVLVFYPGLRDFRSQVWFTAGNQVSVTERVRLLVDTTQRAWRKDQEYFWLLTLGPLIDRVSSFTLMSRVVDLTPDTVPFLEGSTYKPLLTSYVPRFLWPEKPQERFGQIFGHRYKFLLPEDRITSINMPWIVETFVNFGVWGVFLLMPVIGIFLALLSAIFNRSQMTPLEFVTGAAIIFPLVYPSSNVTVMVGSLLPLAVSLWLYFRIGLTIRLPER